MALMIAFEFIVVNISIGYVNPWSPFISELPKKAYQILILIPLDIRLNKPLKNQRPQEAYWILELRILRIAAFMERQTSDGAHQHAFLRSNINIENSTFHHQPAKTGLAIVWKSKIS